MRILAIILCLTLAAAGENTPRASSSAAQHKRVQTPAPQLSDAAIEQALKAKLAKSKMAANGFTVKVSNGTAIIEGKAGVIQHKGAMTRMAKAAGATRVLNNIQISEEARAKARERLASGRRRAQVKRGDPRSQPR
ncbi:MAG: BON domain-containing protein [Acidobacteriaceae bacterium]|nr:BON domain-containing protein [Acidobacteriaceae bacterium]